MTREEKINLFHWDQECLYKKPTVWRTKLIGRWLVRNIRLWWPIRRERENGVITTNPPLLHSDLSFFFPVNGTLLATVDPTVDTPPATAETPPFTRPTPTEGTALTADLVISKLFPPSQATPPTVAPTTPFVALKRPPVTRQIIAGGATGCSFPPSAAEENNSVTFNQRTIYSTLTTGNRTKTDWYYTSGSYLTPKSKDNNFFLIILLIKNHYFKKKCIETLLNFIIFTAL